MTTHQETTKEVFRSINTIMEPWVNATRTWITEAEKVQQTTVDHLNRAFDTSYKLAREGMDIATSMGSTYRKQVISQVDRSVQFFNSLIS